MTTIKLHDLEAKHLAENGETVLLRRVDPQPFCASCSDKMIWIGNLETGWPRATGRQWRYQMRGYCPFGKPGDTITTDDGLNLRIKLVDVVELKAELSEHSAGWYWRVEAEVTP